MPARKIIIATRKSPLALAQTEMVAAHLRATLGVDTELLKIVTTGDKQTEWSLEKRGGKGLFTSELEQALLRGEADVAVHSTKDLPGEMPEGLAVAGYLPRADVRDVLVLRAEIEMPRKIATGSPRRRLQLTTLFEGLEFTEIRGNVDTRLKKIAEQHVADGTVLAAAGLNRLGIGRWPGLVFHPLECGQMVPAVGQGAIALQSRRGDAAGLGAVLHHETAMAVNLERAFQQALGGGCHTAFGAHAAHDTLYFFHESVGLRSFPLAPEDQKNPLPFAALILKKLGLGV